MKHLKIAILVALGIALLALPLSASAKSTPKNITFGCAIALSGWLATDAESQVLTMKMWEKETNGKGGIYVPEYDKRLPVKLILYDDKSDGGQTVKMVEKLILEDKVDFILAPFGTEWHFAMAPLANQYKYPVIGTSITSEQLRVGYHKLPYFFVIETQWPQIGDALVDLCVKNGVKTVANVYVGTLYGIEGSGYVVPRLGVKGIDVSLIKSYPPDTMDLSPLLKEIKALNVDALLATSYLRDALLLVEQTKAINLNPKLLYIAYPASDPELWNKFGKNTQGIVGQGGWDPNNPATIDWAKRFKSLFNRWPDYLVAPHNWAALEIMQQCIEKVGLDRVKVRNMLASETFSTKVWGKVKFVNQYNTLGPWISQWQGGKYERISPKNLKTADFIYPKPPWSK